MDELASLWDEAEEPDLDEEEGRPGERDAFEEKAFREWNQAQRGEDEVDYNVEPDGAWPEPSFRPEPKTAPATTPVSQPAPPPERGPCGRMKSLRQPL